MNMLIAQSPKYTEARTIVDNDINRSKANCLKRIEKLKENIKDLEREFEENALGEVFEKKRINVLQKFGSKKQRSMDQLESQILEINKELSLEEKKLSAFENVKLVEVVDIKGVASEARVNLLSFDKEIHYLEEEIKLLQEDYTRKIDNLKKEKSIRDEYINQLYHLEDKVMKHNHTPQYPGDKWRNYKPSLLTGLNYKSKHNLSETHPRFYSV